MLSGDVATQQPAHPSCALLVQMFLFDLHKMGKRSSDNTLIDVPPSKRICKDEADGVDRLSSLSDELLLHILSFLPRLSLITCQR